MKSDSLLGLGIIGAVAFLAMRRATAAPWPPIDWGTGGNDWTPGSDDPADDPFGPIDWGTGPGWDDPLYPLPDAPLFPIPDLHYEDSTVNSKLDALVYMVRRSEHSAVDVLNDLDFYTFYSGPDRNGRREVRRFNNLSDHPVATGEMRGIPLPDSYCRAAGYSPGCVSTAAGAGQFILPTWQRIRSMHPRLPDFSPSSQLEAIRRLIREKGADRLVEAGDLEGAIYRLSSVWASLPASRANQPQRSLDETVAFYDIGLSAG